MTLPGLGAIVNYDPNDPVVVQSGAGARVRRINMVHKVDAGRLEGGLIIMEGEIAPGGLIPPHTHSREDECSYVVAGEMMFQVGDEIVTATPGSYVIKPRGAPHAFWNSGSQPARVMEIHVPATFDGFCDERHVVGRGHAGWAETRVDRQRRTGLASFRR